MIRLRAARAYPVPEQDRRAAHSVWIDLLNLWPRETAPETFLLRAGPNLWLRPRNGTWTGMSGFGPKETNMAVTQNTAEWPYRAVAEAWFSEYTVGIAGSPRDIW
jgi:hypothetical protein